NRVLNEKCPCAGTADNDKFGPLHQDHDLALVHRVAEENATKDDDESDDNEHESPPPQPSIGGRALALEPRCVTTTARNTKGLERGPTSRSNSFEVSHMHSRIEFHHSVRLCSCTRWAITSLQSIRSFPRDPRSSNTSRA